ncbi:Uncharacterized protein dnm_006130 [Desulfonema magnum]|uniref:Uncharacterized protein n=1 Tax=Desulfonema magnum TaxID=45655 RepID=A0A975GKC9_9BACT|nr:Uncharacterized protein dnm_006130 [Desulfonema magnum]
MLFRNCKNTIFALRIRPELFKSTVSSLSEGEEHHQAKKQQKNDIFRRPIIHRFQAFTKCFRSAYIDNLSDFAGRGCKPICIRLRLQPTVFINSDFAGRGLQPRPEYFPDRRPQTFRTGLQTPSGSRPSFLA